jgi:hypothetical protein
MSAKEINENLLDDLIRIVRSGGDFSAARHHILFWLSKADQLQDEVARLRAQLKMAKKALRKIDDAEYKSYQSSRAGRLSHLVHVVLKELEADE